MANTYTQINIHCVYAVKGHKNLLTAEVRPRVFEYTSGILKGIGLFPMAVNGYSDHVHLFFEMDPAISLSKVIQEVKANSSGWINKNRLIPGKFAWQAGFGGFSYSRSQRNNVIQYILKQEKHHRKRTFKEEYLDLLKKFGIEYNDRFIFEFYE